MESNIPPLPDTLPPVMRDALVALEALSDEALWQVARSVVGPERQEQHHLLLEKNKAGALAEADRALLTQLHEDADLLMLRKAYAYVLLKWRGYRLPTLAELEA